MNPQKPLRSPSEAPRIWPGRDIRRARPPPAALGGVHGRGSSPQAQRLDRRGEKLTPGKAGSIRQRYILWSRIERLPQTEAMLATGLSQATVGRIITAARRVTAYFRNF